MQKTAGTLFKKHRLWLLASIFAFVFAGFVATLGLFNPAPAAAAGTIDWYNYGAFTYEDKTYVLQKRMFPSSKGAGYPYNTPFDDSFVYAEQEAGLASGRASGFDVIYTPAGTPTCVDKNNVEHFHESMRFHISNTSNIHGNVATGFYKKVNAADKDATGNLNCTFPAETRVTSANPQSRRIWFFQEGDKISTFDRSTTFTKGANGPGGSVLYFRDGDAVAPVNGVTCNDMIVKDGSQWFIFPMARYEDVLNGFRVGKDASSEEYDRYKQSGGRAYANCRVASLELRSQLLAGVIVFSGAYGKNKDVPCPGNLPGSVVGFDSEFGKRDFYGVHCRDGGGGRKILDYLLIDNNIVRYNPHDFAPKNGDDGYRLVEGVANRAPKDTPNPGGGVTPKPNPAGGSADTRPVCAIGDYMGYLLCAAATLADAIVTAVQGLIIKFLDVNPLNLSGGDAVYRIWDALRNVANVAFIIAFLIIVFSQATSVGITNYGIKRLLPRLVLVAVLANISYYLCAAAIDLFNVLGAGIQGLVQAIMGNAGIKLTGLEVPAGTGAIEEITLTGIGSGALIILLKAKGVEAIIIPLLIGVLIVIAAVIALIIRQVLITVMVITSSIAMVAWLLPNTESLFKRWYKFFLQLLLMYPMIMLVFAAGHLAAAIIASSASSETDTIVRTFLLGASLMAKWAVLGLIPWLFTAGGFAVGWLFNKGNQLSQKAGQGMRGMRGVKLREQSREAAKEKAYLDRLTGVKGGVRARINRATRGVAMSGIAGTSEDARQELEERLYDARQKLENQRSEALQRRLTRNAALALASGQNVSGSSTSFYDSSTGSNIDLNAEDRAAISYAQSIGAQKSVSGARAIGTMIHDLAEMNESRYNQVLGMGGNVQEREQINNALNNAAMKAGQWQWGYNMVDEASGRVQIGRQKGSTVDAALASIIGSKGLANMPKELYSGDYYDQAAVSSVLQNQYDANADAFIRQTLNINEDKKLDGIARSLGISRDDLEAERQRVGQLYSS